MFLVGSRLLQQTWKKLHNGCDIIQYVFYTNKIAPTFVAAFCNLTYIITCHVSVAFVIGENIIKVCFFFIF